MVIKNYIYIKINDNIDVMPSNRKVRIKPFFIFHSILILPQKTAKKVLEGDLI